MTQLAMKVGLSDNWLLVLMQNCANTLQNCVDTRHAFSLICRKIDAKSQGRWRMAVLVSWQARAMPV
jgi:hypothetical protein